jgi:hypothetical protein
MKMERALYPNERRFSATPAHDGMATEPQATGRGIRAHPRHKYQFVDFDNFLIADDRQHQHGA